MKSMEIAQQALLPAFTEDDAACFIESIQHSMDQGDMLTRMQIYGFFKVPPALKIPDYE